MRDESTVRETARVGTKMADGTIYAGLSPTTHRPMYVAPADAPLAMHFHKAAQYAKQLQVGDKKDFRVPDRAELRVLFENRNEGALKGTFNTSGALPSGDYWSSTATGSQIAREIRFSDGYEDYDFKSREFSVRCVR